MNLFRLFMIGIVASLLGPAHSPVRASPWGAEYLPNVPVVTQDGETLRFYDDVIKGKIVVINFIFTTCRDVCPVVTARLAQVYDKLGAAAGRDVNFVSISIDPMIDTPLKLKEYASAFGVGKGWRFLTGSLEDINIIRNKLGERSRNLSDHNNLILIHNSTTSEWSKDSAYNDINILTANILAIDPRNMSGSSATNLAAPSDFGFGQQLRGPPEPPGKNLYLKICAGCHTVGKGGKVGPDLAGVVSRRSREWVVAYLVNPQKMRVEGDRIALDLIAQYPAVRMPNLSLSEIDAADLISYIEAMTYGVKADSKPQKSHHNGKSHSHHH